MPFETALVHQAKTTARFPISGVDLPGGTLASVSPRATAPPKDLRNSRISQGTLPQMILRCSCSWRSLSCANSGRKFRPQMRHSTMPFPLRIVRLFIRGGGDIGISIDSVVCLFAEGGGGFEGLQEGKRAPGGVNDVGGAWC